MKFISFLLALFLIGCSTPTSPFDSISSMDSAFKGKPDHAKGPPTGIGPPPHVILPEGAQVPNFEESVTFTSVMTDQTTGDKNGETTLVLYPGSMTMDVLITSTNLDYQEIAAQVFFRWKSDFVSDGKKDQVVVETGLPELSNGTLTYETTIVLPGILQDVIDAGGDYSIESFVRLYKYTPSAHIISLSDHFALPL